MGRGLDVLLNLRGPDALRAGCRFLGLERDAAYVQLAALRLRDAELLPDDRSAAG